MTRTNMKKFIGSIKRTSAVGRSKSSDNQNGLPEPLVLPQGDSPEAVVVREAVAFCEAGAPGAPGAGDEYLHLPAIVDAAESSPHAAREVAGVIQRYLSKQNYSKGYAQYNSVMLLRILTDNPGRIFTQNFDKSFISTIKTLLRESKDSSVQQITRETLDYLEAEKLNENDSLTPLVEMWRKEKGAASRMYSTSVGIDGTAVITHDFAHTHQGRSHSQAVPRVPRESRPPRGLPPPEELAARIEEARTGARLLVQMVQSTPPSELVGNELIKEFAERARQAQKSVQTYMACENPPPDEHTMLTLIETSEQLSISMTKHQRAVLQARKATGQSSTGTSPQPQPQHNQQDPFNTALMQNALPPQQPPRPQQYQQQYEQTQHTQQPRYNNYESDDLYNSAAATVSPNNATQHSFMPPPGPPPARRQEPAPTAYVQPHTQNYQDPYRGDPASTTRTHEAPSSTTKDYNVSENPFADDSAYAAPPHPPPQSNSNSYSLFNRAAGQLRDPVSSNRNSDRPAGQNLDASSYPTPPPQLNQGANERPGIHGYNSGWQPTPSFINRQESSEAHITMSGASPERR